MFSANVRQLSNGIICLKKTSDVTTTILAQTYKVLKINLNVKKITKCLPIIY